MEADLSLKVEKDEDGNNLLRRIRVSKIKSDRPNSAKQLNLQGLFESLKAQDLDYWEPDCPHLLARIQRKCGQRMQLKLDVVAREFVFDREGKRFSVKVPKNTLKTSRFTVKFD